MKSRNIFIASVMTSILCLGVAYASYWDQEIQVATTVNAGELAIVVESESISNEDYVETAITFADDTLSDADISSDGMVVTENDLIVTIDDMYPGSKVEYEFDVRNTGTLGILFDDLTIQCLPVESSCGSDDDKNYHWGWHNGVEEVPYKWKKANKKKLPTLCPCGHLTLDQHITIEMAVDDKPYTSIKSFVETVKNDEIPDGDSRTYRVRIWFDKDKDLKENQLEEVKAQYIFSINYKQFNDLSVTSSDGAADD